MNVTENKVMSVARTVTELPGLDSCTSKQLLCQAEQQVLRIERERISMIRQASARAVASK